MGQWIKYVVILIVLGAWGYYIATQVAAGHDIPLAVWSVPGATFALLTDKSPISIIRGNSTKKEEE